MYSQSDIEDAVAGGALTAEQAASLRNHIAARTGTPTADEEPVRWLLGFNDVYVFYSSILLLVGLGWLGSKIDIGDTPSPFMALFVAAAAWGLAEFFSRRKRLAFSGITVTRSPSSTAFSSRACLPRFRSMGPSDTAIR